MKNVTGLSSFTIPVPIVCFSFFCVLVCWAGAPIPLCAPFLLLMAPQAWWPCPHFSTVPSSCFSPNKTKWNSHLSQILIFLGCIPLRALQEVAKMPRLYPTQARKSPKTAASDSPQLLSLSLSLYLHIHLHLHLCLYLYQVTHPRIKIGKCALTGLFQVWLLWQKLGFICPIVLRMTTGLVWSIIFSINPVNDKWGAENVHWKYIYETQCRD